MVHPAQEKKVRVAAFVALWAALLGFMVAVVLWPVVVIAVTVLAMTGGMAWLLTHL